MLCLIVGGLGSGKSLLGTIIAKFSRKPVVANYELRLLEYEQLDLSKFMESEYNDRSVILDEAYIYLDSRRSMAMSNQLMSYVLFQSRKKSLNIYLMAQLSKSIDIRYRMLVDLVIECERVQAGFRYIMYKPKDPSTYIISILTYEQAKKYFKYYNTNEIISNNANTYKFKEDSKKITKIKEIVPQLIKDWEPEFRKSHPKAKLKNPNRSWVRIWCMQHNQSEKERDIYDYLKAHY